LWIPALAISTVVFYLGAFCFWVGLGYLFNWLLSWFLYGLIPLLLAVFSTEDYYVPYGFISYCLHAVTHIAGFAMLTLVSLRMLAGKRPESATGATSTQPVSRAVYVLRALAKAFLIAIVTGTASYIGGVIGGGIVFVVSAGLAAFFGPAAEPR
jgi:hypothetical protein